MTAGFNLLDEPWIPAAGTDGDESTLSLLGVLSSAHDLVDVTPRHATERTALVRLLLAFLHRALDGPPTDDDWLRLWSEGRFDPVVLGSYADRWRGRFDLFDEDLPFFQVPGLEPTGKDGWKTLGELSLEAQKGDRLLFTDRSGDAGGTRTPAEAALWLVHAHAYDTAGIKTGAIGDPHANSGKSYGNTVGWAGHLTSLLVGGRTLFETLMLNLVPLSTSGAGRVSLSGPGDLPAWEKAETFTADSLRDPEVAPTGPVDLFTWQSRRVRLDRDDQGRVTRVLVCGGPKLHPWNMHRSESHTVWVYSKNQSDKQKSTVYRPQVVDAAVQPWRGLGALMPLAPRRVDPDHVPPTPAVLSWLGFVVDELGLHGRTLRLDRSGIVYGPQSAVVDHLVGDTLAVPAALLDRTDEALQTLAESVLHTCGDLVSAVGKLAWNLARAEGDEDPGSPSTAARTHAWEALDAPVREWLTGLGRDVDLAAARADVLATAGRTVRDVGQQLVEGAGPGAWRHREDVLHPGVAWSSFLRDVRCHTETNASTDGAVA